MGAWTSKKRLLQVFEQKNKQAVNINLPKAPVKPQPSDEHLNVRPSSFFKTRMKTGRNGIDVFQNLNYEENDIKTVKQAVQCS